MGMFDTLIFNCQKCGKETDSQTKLGDCCLDSWRVGDRTTIKDGSYMVKDACHECGNLATVVIKNQGIFWMALEAPTEDTLQEIIYGNLIKVGDDPKAENERIINLFAEAIKQSWEE
jgi:hypothetical protein